MSWYTVAEVKPMKIVFDGECSRAEALRKMRAAHEHNGAHIVVTRGKNLGKFVAEIGEFVPQLHRHPGPVAGCQECMREADKRHDDIVGES